jgi:hypothetical protein
LKGGVRRKAGGSLHEGPEWLPGGESGLTTENEVNYTIVIRIFQLIHSLAAIETQADN